MAARNLSVTMLRDNLDQLPEHPVPAGYEIHPWCPGDEHHWFAIQQVADRYNNISRDLYERQFGHDPELLAQRQLFLCELNGSVIGTVTAWFADDFHGQPAGRIHWLAIIPRGQGQGLGKCLLAQACARLRELSHQRIYLVTSTARLTAINLYLGFGFRPDIRNDHDQSIWAAISPALSPPLANTDAP